MVVPFAILVVALLIAWGIHVAVKNRQNKALRHERYDLRKDIEKFTKDLERTTNRAEENWQTILRYRKFHNLFVPQEQVNTVLRELAIRLYQVDMEEREIQQEKKQISSAARTALKADVESRKRIFDEARDLVRAITEHREYYVHDAYQSYLPEELLKKQQTSR